MGVAAARPECPTVLFIGDGGLLMSMGELEVVIREDLPLVIIVMNDAAYGAEVHILQAQNLPVAKAQFADVDFAAIAAPLGYEVATVHSLDELRALAPTLAKPEGPILIDCKINSAVIAPFISEFTGG
jgi:thiamine pyrophosphate-dependent acetolactate synthase large subunit-like protein